MRNKLLKIWVISLLAVTALLFAWYQYGMNRVITIDGHSSHPLRAYDDREFGGQSVAGVEKTPGGMIMSCQFSKQYVWPFCGFAINLAPVEGQGIDLTDFSRIELDIRTSGPELKPVRVFLRSFNPAFSVKGRPELLQVNEMQYIPNRERIPFPLLLKNFQVASWWMNEHHISPEYGTPDLGNVVAIEVTFGDKLEEKLHHLYVNSIQFHGKWINQNQLLTIILGMWIISALVYLISSFWHTHRDIQAIKQQKKELEEVNAALELERRELKELATHDPLTGVYNRVGLRNHLYEKVSQVKQKKASLSVIFMDIDKFKDINDHYGHDVGDNILKSFAQFVAENTRGDDFFCRWGGEEFILLCHETKLESASALAEKLRTMVVEQNWPHGLSLTCSFGVAQMKSTEDVSRFIKRADEALYSAKESGRNCVKASANGLAN